MNTTYSVSSDTASGKKIWNRADTAKLVSDYESREPTVSQRDFAKKTGVPRSTLRAWVDRKNSIDAHPVLIEFFFLNNVDYPARPRNHLKLVA